MNPFFYNMAYGQVVHEEKDSVTTMSGLPQNRLLPENCE